jgi:UDP-N-acetylmuramoylalanine--D-glutamate ligase
MLEIPIAANDDAAVRYPAAYSPAIAATCIAPTAPLITTAMSGRRSAYTMAAARAFAPLEHRLEFVREAGGVRYYHDSYATRPEAALAAARALDQALHIDGRPAGDRGSLGLILGGSEKFADFGELAAGLAALPRLRAIALIGQTAERLEKSLLDAGAIKAETQGEKAGRAWRRCATLEDAVEFLRGELPKDGAGSILLSPACASFGLFKDYKERGKAFKKIVSGL